MKRGPITFYSINFYQHKNFYIFFDEKIVDRFFNSVQGSFESVRGKEFKMQVYFELKNYQQTETIELENTRVWLTNMLVGRYFNESIRGEMKRNILKRVIINGFMDSSWFFKRFNKLQVIVTDKSAYKNISSS